MSNRKQKHSPNSRLHDAREERGWSQPELAAKIGTNFVAISRWENGLTFPSAYFRKKLCEVFDKTLAELDLIPPSSVPRIENVPITRNPFFTGRTQLLSLLYERLSTARTAMLTQPQALFGLGGIGKTQTAAEYAFRYGDEYTHVFWVLAATRETLVADVVTLAELLDLPEKDEQDQQKIVAAVKRWLATHEGWLLVLDNADDLLLAREFLPTNHKGYILYTTRAQAAGAIAASVEVEKLNVQDGSLLLLRWAKRLDIDMPLNHAKTEDRAAAERIVMEMDGLPLALVQAGAYIEETGCSLTDYLSHYATHRKDLLARRSPLFFDYPETVATTWSLSFQQVEQESPAAADVLRLCAFLAADVIPEELLMRGAAELGDAPGSLIADAFKLNEALEVLRRYSLIRRDSNAHTLSIHRLVQIVLKESLNEETQRAWAERTVRVVNAAFPEANYGSSTNYQYYLPHAQECATLIAHYHLHFPEAAQLLYEAGAVLYFHGFYPQSQSLHQQALAIREQVLEPDHPATAESLNILGMLSRIEGDDGQAEQYHRQALAIREKILGPKHLATAFSLNNLGVLYRIQEKYEQAEQFLVQALTIREQLLGSEHPETLLTFINLAKLYSEQGKYEQSERLLQQTLVSSTRALEPEHPLIAQNLNVLARLYYEQGDNERAEILWMQSLAILEKSLGPEHSATAERLNDIAELYVAQGLYTEAQSYCQRAISICEKTLGPEHPDTITYRKHLTRIRNKKEAE
ncbi:MAG TPA: tetratricopeptide repeat protein [Ktedonobacteraceae bacterium]|nr:tetratricopeptide repeat protein [Ktedonobacteraceae bacterium]